MIKSLFTRKRVAAIAAVGALATPLLAQTPANADPKQFTAFVAVGSDTTQSVMDAFAGETNGALYTPLRSSAASGNRQIANWIAAPGSQCITPQAPGATILRPIGSTNGRRALSRAIDGGLWGGATCGATGAGKATAGIVHIARSSAGPSSAGTDLTYIPFARGALSFAYYRASGGAPVTQLTSAQLVSIMTTDGGVNIGGVQIMACGIQTGSGTYQSWNTALGISTSAEATGTADCNALAGGRIEEHDSDGLRAKGNLVPAGTQVIVGMDAAPFISQWNGVAVDRTDPGVDLGQIDGLPKPYVGTRPATAPPASPALAPNTTFYNNTTYGRDVYNVIDSALLGGLPSANQDIKTLLVGSSSAICSAAADTIVQLFGFMLAPTCGDTSLTGPLVA